MLKHIAYAAGAVALLSATATPGAIAGTNAHLGDVMPVAFDFCPVGWLPAQGQVIAISSNTSLYSLFGTTYGGDGRTTFALPDLRGRMVAGWGTGPGLTSRPVGAKWGQQFIQLQSSHLPPHSHEVYAATGALTGVADNHMVAVRAEGTDVYRARETDGSLASPATMADGAISQAGGGQEIDLRSRALGINWCIAATGFAYPSRN